MQSLVRLDNCYQGLRHGDKSHDVHIDWRVIHLSACCNHIDGVLMSSDERAEVWRRMDEVEIHYQHSFEFRNA